MKTTPQWLVERLAAGELSPPEAAEVRARLEAEDGLHRLAEVLASNTALLQQYPPGPALGEIRRRAGLLNLPSTPRRFVIPALVVAAAAAAVLVLRPSTLPPSETDVEEVTRIKGLSPRLLVHRKVGARIEVLSAHDRAKPGDVLQLGYVGAGRRFGAIISVDGRGQVTQHFPEEGSAAAPLEGSGEVLLPHAYVLDDAPQFERFVLLTSNEPFSLESLKDLPAHVEQTSVELEKVSP